VGKTNKTPEIVVSVYLQRLAIILASRISISANMFTVLRKNDMDRLASPASNDAHKLATSSSEHVFAVALKFETQSSAINSGLAS